FCFLRQRRNGVESDVRQYREGCAPEEIACCERSRVVERPREKRGIAVGMPQDVPNGRNEDDYNDGAHGGCQTGIDSRGCLDSLQIQQRKDQRKENLPAPHRNSRREFMRLPRTPNRANQRVHNVVHHHAPAGDVSRRGMNLSRNVSECRPGARIHLRHAPIAAGSRHPRAHPDQHRRDQVSAPAMVAMMATAVSYGRMAQVYPSAGSAFTYVAREIHPAAGYVTGWSMVMDYIVNPLICTVWCAGQAHEFAPGIPVWGWKIFFAVVFTLLNLQGIKTSARVNAGLTAAMSAVVVVVFVSAIRYILGHP